MSAKESSITAPNRAKNQGVGWPMRIIAILHLVGAVGIALPSTRSYLLPLTPLNLVISVGLLLVYVRQWTAPRLAAALGIVVAGFMVEYVGISTGFPFGDYQYGAQLGPKVLGVPLVIGCNWLMLCVSTCSIANHYFRQPLASSLLAAGLMTALDFLIEPVAVLLDYWAFHEGMAPVSNYVAWFITSWAFTLLTLRVRLLVPHPVALGFFAIQLAFFVTLLAAL